MQSPNMASSFASLNGLTSPPFSPNGLSVRKAGSGYFNSSRTASGNYSSFNQAFNHGGNGYKYNFVQETAVYLKKKSIAQLGSEVYHGISDTTFVHFLEWIRHERLTTLPHKGSRWDRVLIRALFFAEQLHHFDSAVDAYAVDSPAAAAMGYGHARLLLEVSPGLAYGLWLLTVLAWIGELRRP